MLISYYSNQTMLINQSTRNIVARQYCSFVRLVDFLLKRTQLYCDRYLHLSDAGVIRQLPLCPLPTLRRARGGQGGAYVDGRDGPVHDSYSLEGLRAGVGRIPRLVTGL